MDPVWPARNTSQVRTGSTTAGFLLGSYWQTVYVQDAKSSTFLKEWRQRCAYRSLHSFKIETTTASNIYLPYSLERSIRSGVLQPCRQASAVSSAFNTATQIHWANVQAQGLQWVCSLCWPVVRRGRFILEKQHTQPDSDLDFVMTGVFQKENNIWINHMQLSVFLSGDKAGGKNRPNLLL